MEGFLRYEFGGLIRGRAYFRNFTVGDFSAISLTERSCASLISRVERSWRELISW